jgi:hypothetical protein
MRWIPLLFLGATSTFFGCSSDSSNADTCTERVVDGGSGCTGSSTSPGKGYTCTGSATPPGDRCEQRVKITINGQSTTTYCCP